MPNSFMNFCPGCGSENIKYHIRKYTCPDCGFVFYVNVAGACGALILRDGELLIARRGREPAKGLYDLPGGFIDYEETAEAALRREVREELGIEIDDFAYFATHPNQYLYKGIEYQVLDLFFTCRAIDPASIRPQDDVEDVIWTPLDEINPDKFAFPSTRYVVTKLVSGRT